MNIIRGSLMRAVAITAVLATGIATTISSGGGSSSGGDGGSPGAVTPPSNLLAINGDNAQAISAALIAAVDITFDISDITGGEIAGQSAAGSANAHKILRNYSEAAVTVAESCLYGGTVTVTSTLANPNTLTIGDVINAVFDSCDEGDGYLLNGPMSLTVAAIQGDVMTDVFLLGLDLTMTDMSITEGGETVVVDANMTLTLDTLGFPVIVETVEGSELSLTIGPEVLVFTNFEHVFQVDLGVIPEAVLVTVNGSLESAQMGGAIDYATTLAVEAFGDNNPYVGQILISGNDSSVRIVINDSTSVTLEVDTNGDGVIDQYIDTTFTALSGDASGTSSMDRSTALAIAQEVTHATTGFGLLATVPGLQFFSTELFGQVQQLGLSGNFGPLDVNCGDAGTAVVSGFIATAETFAADDSLTAILSGCSGNLSDPTNGQLDLLVSSFTQETTESPDIPTPLFRIVGTVTATNLEQVAENTAYVGSGTFEMDYDYQFYFGPIVVNAFTSAFSVAHGSVTNVLTNASVTLSGSIDGSSGSYTGWLVSDRFPGVYRYESGYSWYPWGGQSTASPYLGGGALITADDGSTVRIVVDQHYIRLDVDEDGDSIVDTTIPTLWTELLQ